MAITLRAGTSSDAEACGEICFKAFTEVSDRHGFPGPFPRLEFAIRVVSVQLSEPNYYAVVAEIDGQIVGSNFLDERSDVAGVGPITIDPSAQGSGVGRMLMEDVLKRASERRFPSVRLVLRFQHMVPAVRREARRLPRFHGNEVSRTEH